MPQYSIAIHEDADDLLESPINFSTSGDNTVIPGASGQITSVYKLFIVAGGTTTLTFKDGANSLASMMIMPPDGMVLDFDTRPWFTLGTSDDFVINSSVAVQISGRIYYTQGTGVGAFPANAYVTEDGTVFYVAEDGVTFYVQES